MPRMCPVQSSIQEKHILLKVININLPDKTKSKVQVEIQVYLCPHNLQGNCALIIFQILQHNKKNFLAVETFRDDCTFFSFF